MSFVLNLLYLLLLALVSPWVAWQSWRHGRYRRGWREKLLGPRFGPPTDKSIVWLHAVSVGEVQVLRTLVEKIEAERPDLFLAISVTTDSGMDLAKKLYPKHFVFFAPFDFSWSVRRALQVLKPQLIVLAELEVWPNWIMAAQRHQVPIAIMNGRLSERSFQGYSRIPKFIRHVLFHVDWVGAQSQTYAERFVALGVPAKNVMVTGNTKFDGASGDRTHGEVVLRRQLLGLSGHEWVWVAGSTQAPEEELILSTYQALVARFPKLRLLLIPRHAERFEQVAGWIEASGLAWDRRSRCPDKVSNPDWQVFLGDSIGELRWWWGIADIGFVGGSFGDRGGQNMIEPCAYGVATCFGPNTKNFKDIVQLLLDAHACEQLQSESDLLPWMERMLTRETERMRMAETAKQTCAQHRGACHRTWEQLLRLL